MRLPLIEKKIKKNTLKKAVAPPINPLRKSKIKPYEVTINYLLPYIIGNFIILQPDYLTKENISTSF